MMGSVSLAWLKKMMRMVSSTCDYLTPNYTVYSSIKSEHDNLVQRRAVCCDGWMDDINESTAQGVSLHSNGYLTRHFCSDKEYSMCMNWIHCAATNIYQNVCPML